MQDQGTVLQLEGMKRKRELPMTDVVFVELPEVGRRVASGEACAVVESVKTASDIYCPVNGEIVEVNDAVVDDPSLANSSPYGDGWFFKVRLDSDTGIEKLLSPDAYRTQIGG